MAKGNSEITLAVLPFQVVSDKESPRPILQNFGEDLSNNLSKFEGLSVLSFYSTQFLSLKDPEKLESLNISYIITGSLKQVSGQTSLNVQLLSFPDLRILFNQEYQVVEDQILATENDLILQIVNLLKSKLDKAVLSYSYKRSHESLAAYESWLIGNDYLARRTPEDDQIAREHFEKALHLEPNFARAYSGISMSYFNEWSCQLWDKWEVSQTGAKKYALKAIELDGNDYVSLGILGRVYLYQAEFDKAEYYLRKSLQMNKNDANHLMQLALSFMFLGYIEEAEELYNRGCLLNPFLEGRYLTYGATILFENGKYKDALDLGRKLDINTVYIDFPIYLGAASYYLGDKKEALKYWDQFLENFKSHIYFEEGQSEADALSWHININPYQHSSRLESFREFVRGNQKVSQFLPKETHSLIESEPVINVLNEFMQISYKGKSITVKDTKGIRDLMQLLQNPRREIHCMELMGSSLDVDNGVKVLDEEAKSQLQKRIKELHNAIEEAESFNDLERISDLRYEYEMLINHMSSSLGMDGRSRKTGSSVEKARAAVTLRIRGSIKKIKQDHQQLATHLSNSIKTGTICSYNPEQKILWQINT